MLFLATIFILLHAPNDDRIVISLDHIVSLQDPLSDKVEAKRLYPISVKCLINMDDGKFFGSVEKCNEVHDMIKALTQGEKR